jgi:hypothetical protein
MLTGDGLNKPSSSAPRIRVDGEVDGRSLRKWPPKKPCSFPGCHKPHSCGGLCDGHDQQRRAGKELFALGSHRQPRIPVPHPTITGAMLLPLTKGYSAIIDAADAAIVSDRRWQANVTPTNVYAMAGGNETGSTGLHLHRFVWLKWGMPETPEIDHRNTDGLDCRRENLRAADHRENMWNLPLTKRNTTGLKGVSPRPNGRKWRARIRHFGRLIFLGEFDDPVLAHAAYVKAATEMRGEFARAA